MRTGPLLRNIAIFAVLFSIVIFLIARVRTGREEAPPATTAAEEQGAPDSSARRIELVGPSTVSRRNAAGESVWEAGIKGNWHVDETQGTVVASDVSWRIVGRDLEQLEVIAGRFEADEASDTVRFADSVEATLPGESAKLSAEHLEYDLGAQQLAAEGGVVLRWRKLLVTGQRLSADLAAHQMSVRGKARMTYEG